VTSPKTIGSLSSQSSTETSLVYLFVYGHCKIGVVIDLKYRYSKLVRLGTTQTCLLQSRSNSFLLTTSTKQ